MTVTTTTLEKVLQYNSSRIYNVPVCKLLCIIDPKPVYDNLSEEVEAQYCSSQIPVGVYDTEILDVQEGQSVLANYTTPYIPVEDITPTNEPGEFAKYVAGGPNDKRCLHLPTPKLIKCCRKKNFVHAEEFFCKSRKSKLCFKNITK